MEIFLALVNVQAIPISLAAVACRTFASMRSNGIYTTLGDVITVAEMNFCFALIHVIANRRWIAGISRMAFASGCVLDKGTESIDAADWTCFEAAEPIAEVALFAFAFIASVRVCTVRVNIAKMRSNFALVYIQTWAALVCRGKSVETGAVSSVSEGLPSASARVTTIRIEAIRARMASVIVIAFVDVQAIAWCNSYQAEERFSIDGITNRTSTSIRAIGIQANFLRNCVIANI